MSRTAASIAVCASLIALPSAQVERDRRRRELALMIDAERSVAGVRTRPAPTAGTIVSFDVVTAAPAEAEECPLAAKELVARLRAESAAIVAAVLLVEAEVEVEKLAELMLVDWVPEGLAPEVET